MTTATLNTAQALTANNEIFSVATLIYTRLRRVSGRVIDVMYLVENSDYARAVLQLALATHDEELCRYALRLNSILANLMDADAEITSPQTEAQQLDAVENIENIDDLTEPIAEEIYRAQVSHHYIGALR
jgi:DNA-binding FrmR family transcriptional regulator